MSEALAWHKSSYCQEGEACLHTAAHEGTVLLTESADPAQAVLSTTPTTWKALLQSLMPGRPWPARLVQRWHAALIESHTAGLSPVGRRQRAGEAVFGFPGPS
ncbi:DUF397 domain-containing protein [Streptomyces sp. ISL-100]|uniref:DUF397 domain-containing protein n=1 Tax=Streptomyces sp. ISL-100 TaxID=2819173 RepID=UPI001BEC4A60|nr:DUF397 domain-containing protein [Streptomyces sp. ISL-100]MBT2398389.1 DUF397 domain-containing protein [Streptomyces sp. ISL-100]